MPVAYLDLPAGVAVDAKQTLLGEVAGFIREAYLIPDARVVIREWPPEQMRIDGNLDRPMRPICNFFVPPGLPAEAKRHLMRCVSCAIADACTVTTTWVLGFFNEYPLQRDRWDALQLARAVKR